MSVQWISDFTGPLPPDTGIDFWVYPLASEQIVAHWGQPTDSPTGFLPLSLANSVQFPYTAALQEGAEITVKTRLSSPIGTIDEGTTTGLHWNSSSQLTQLLQEVKGEGGALTPIQSQQLAETHESTFPAISLDSLTLEEISSGPQGGVVAANLGAWIYGVLVRIRSVPPDFRVDTADGDYWVRSLAVVRIYRGSDLWKRVPVHTSSKIVSFVDEGLVVAVSTIVPVQWLLQISVQVSIAEGVLAQVYLMSTP